MRLFAMCCLLAVAALAPISPHDDSIPGLRAAHDPPPMPAEHLRCRIDADCTRVFRRCGTCDCGAPVNVDHAAFHDAERAQRCAAVEGPVCEMDCGDTTPRCVDGTCGLGHGPG